MALFKWSKSHSAYIPEIDAEHRALFRHGEELHEAVRTGAGVERLLSIVKALMATAEDHFSHEERLMRSARYPSYEWHKRQHDGVRRRMEQFAALIAQGDSQAALLLIDYLWDWIQGHTGLTDRLMAAYLRNYERGQAVAS